MTVLELAERDYKKSKINYLQAKERKGVNIDELQHLEELMLLRKQILQRVKGRERV